MRIVLAGLVVLGFVIGAIALAPLRWALSLAPIERFGLSADSASGTIWNGRLSGVRFGGLSLGEAAVQANVTDLLRLTPGLRFGFRGPAGAGSGRISGSPQAWRVAVREIALAADQLPLPVALDGQVTLRNVQLTFRDGACAAAAGELRTNALEASAARLGWAGPPLGGALACAGDKARAVLTGAGADGAVVAVDVTLSPTLQLEARTKVTGIAPQIGAALTGYGFAQAADGFVRYDGGALAQR